MNPTNPWTGILGALVLAALPPAKLLAGTIPGLDTPVDGWQSPFIAAGVGDTIWGSVSSNVQATVVWDDGSGPALYFGGAFSTAASQVVRGIARFDGSTISSLAGGLDDESTIFAMTVFQGDLIVAGEFEQIGGLPVHNIARFDGTNWHALGAGCAASLQISSVTVFDDDLIVAGDCGGAQQVSRWDGANWSSLGANLVGMNGAVMRLAEHGGELYAGGTFRQVIGTGGPTRIARFDGSQWQALSGTHGEGIDQNGALVLAMASFEGDLYLGGSFTNAGGVAVNRIARWDGSDWHDVGGGVSGTDVGGTSPQVMALGVYDQALIVGGRFLAAGSVESPHAARWNGASWLPLTTESGGLSNSAVMTIDRFQGSLVLGGGFLRISHDVVNRIALFDGDAFYPVGDITPNAPNGQIEAVALHDGELIIGGDFDRIGTLDAHYIAAWDGSQWRALIGSSGQGLGYTPQFSETGYVRDAVQYQGDLIVAGQITQADGQDVGHIARWDGTNWHPMGNGFNFAAFALHVHNGQLYAGGLFTASRDESIPLLRVARWNGSQWVAVEGGFNSSVLDFVTYNGHLHAAGAMTASGATTLSRIARLDATSGWQPLPDSPTGTIYTLTVYNGELIAGGGFSQAGGELVSRIARFDGSQWRRLESPNEAFGVGPSSNHFPSALAAGNDGLYVTGNFVTAGGGTVDKIAIWTETDGWQPLADADGFGLGRDATGRALLSIGDTLIVAGRFARAGEKAAWNLAYWHSRDTDRVFRDRFE